MNLFKWRNSDASLAIEEARHWERARGARWCGWRAN
jgi:hypothetical protein